MRFFDFLKNRKPKVGSEDKSAERLYIKGPAYIRTLLRPINYRVPGLPKFDPKIQFVGKLATEADQTFSLKYHGELSTGGLIIDAGNNPLKLIAVGGISGEEILLFDKSIHGWNGLIRGAFNDQDSQNEAALLDYVPNSTNVFEIYLIAYYNQGTKSELLDECVDGVVEIGGGRRLDVQTAFDDGFDAIEIYAVDSQDKAYSVVAEELA
ncbi:MAG: hypothetical protein EOO88_47725 [Pedobacter sp.]|nr:MAG: hypothetical protein EOO88_47725 [Pedobacter sp.]